jgi:DinB superfamily
MDKATLEQMWDQFRQKYGVYLRLLEAIPENRYTTVAVPGMRPPAELSVHISGTVVRDIAEGVAKGEITADEAGEASTAERLGSKAALIAFARECFERADAAVKRIGDAELAAMVPTPWKSVWPGSVAFHVLSDEFMHHRGQLYCYARACGVEPPFMWGYADNDAEFRPAAAAASGA